MVIQLSLIRNNHFKIIFGEVFGVDNALPTCDWGVFTSLKSGSFVLENFHIWSSIHITEYHKNESEIVGPNPAVGHTSSPMQNKNMAIVL